MFCVCLLLQHLEMDGQTPAFPYKKEWILFSLRQQIASCIQKRNFMFQIFILIFLPLYDPKFIFTKWRWLSLSQRTNCPVVQHFLALCRAVLNESRAVLNESRAFFNESIVKVFLPSPPFFNLPCWLVCDRATVRSLVIFRASLLLSDTLSPSSFWRATNCRFDF